MAVRTPAQIQTQYEALFAEMQADGAITAARFRSFWVDVQDTIFAAGVMRPIVLGNGVIITAMLADDAVTNAKLAAGAADRNALPDDVINTAKLDDDAVTNPKLANNAVTDAKQHPDTRTATWAKANNAAGRMPQARTFGDAFINAVLQGQVITFTQADGTTVTITLPAAGTPAEPTHTRYAFWMPAGDTTPTIADITGGQSYTDRDVVIPAFPAATQQTRLGFGQLATEPDLTTIQQQGSPFGNEFSDFTKGTIGTYEYWLSDDDRLPVTAGTTWEAY